MKMLLCDTEFDYTRNLAYYLFPYTEMECYQLFIDYHNHLFHLNRFVLFCFGALTFCVTLVFRVRKEVSKDSKEAQKFLKETASSSGNETMPSSSGEGSTGGKRPGTLNFVSF